MLDVVNFNVRGGRGGDGHVSFRREKFVPRGGPDGGDGGRGGDVIFMATEGLSTLQQYSNTRFVNAQDGKSGNTKQRHGAGGDDTTILVPVGSVIWDISETVGSPGKILKQVNERGNRIADLDVPGVAHVIARGGRGGRGNKRFAKSTRQTPTFAQSGMDGQERLIQIELKLLADVGIVGLPNAGKSTLLTGWSKARPKIGAFEFTTLEPNLGVVYTNYDSFVAADMPGLIEGASEGVGLGHDFLRHIERTKVLVHVVDMSADDPLRNIELIERELSEFGNGLADKPVIYALNKIDNEDSEIQIELLDEELAARYQQRVSISGLTGTGLQELADMALQQIRSTSANDPPTIQLKPAPAEKEKLRVVRDENLNVDVLGDTAVWWASTLDLTHDEARAEFFDRMRRLGLDRELRRAGVADGDSVRFGSISVDWEMG